MGRFIEPSTWAGLAVLMEAVKAFFPQYAPALVGVQTALGGVAVALRETGAGARDGAGN